MKKRPRGGSSVPSRRTPGSRSSGLLQYKVVELSTVDEASLEAAVNAWTLQGWNLENVQFAMRESSKRPAMAFVFFTREAENAEHDATQAQAKLHRLAAEPPLRPVSAQERLIQLAGEDEPDPE